MFFFRFVGLDAADELLHYRIFWVDLHRLARRHVHRERRVAKRLRFHNALHVGRPTVLAGDEDAGRVRKTVRYDDFFNLVTENLLDNNAKVFAGLLPLLTRLLLVFGLVEFKTFLGSTSFLPSYSYSC